jgi:hypothetical protein
MLRFHAGGCQRPAIRQALAVNGIVANDLIVCLSLRCPASRAPTGDAAAMAREGRVVWAAVAAAGTAEGALSPASR